MWRARWVRVKPHLIAAVTVAVALVTGAAPSAWAEYSVRVGTRCPTFTTLAAALGTGQPQIYVQGVNIERSETIVPGVTLIGASAPCTAGTVGTITLDPGTATRVLQVIPGATLTLQAVIVAGGNVSGNGGTIYLNMDATLLMQQGSTVRDGIASARGGCVYADHAKIIMDPGTAVSDCQAGTDGGGVAIVGAQSTGGYDVLRNLVSNTAVASGGGTWIDGALVCLFEAANNAAGLDGGAAYVTSAIDTAWLGTYATQTTNAASRDGGGVFITGGEARLDASSQLDANSAIGNGGGIRATGAATVYLDPGTVIASNHAQGHGGGIHGDGLSTITLSEVFDTGMIGSGEHSHGPCGTPFGAVSIDGNQAGYDANGTQTSAVRDGGGIYLSNATVVKTNPSIVAISNNRASDAGGGVAAYAGASVMLTHVDFTGNIATRGNGGGLLANATATATITFTAFTGNTAKLGGGGGAAVVAAGATYDKDTFTSNIGLAGGGLGLNSAATATVTRTDLMSNTALTGGGIYTGNSSALTMYTGTITSNTADLGAGIAADAGSATLGDAPPATSCQPGTACCPAGGACVTIAANTAKGVVGRGGAILLMADNATVQVRRSIIVGNAADVGGALWMDRASQTLWVHNTAIVSNGNPAGTLPAIGAQAGTLGMINDTIAHNNLGINLWPATVATMYDSLVIQNGLDIGGLTTGATMSGTCNAVESATTQAAIVGTGNVATTSTTASVNASTGAPINTTDIVNKCSVLEAVDLLGLPRIGGPSDRGAYERQ